MTPKTMNEQMEEIEKKIKNNMKLIEEDVNMGANFCVREEDYISYLHVISDKELQARKSQLQIDMKIVEELKEKLKEEVNEWIWDRKEKNVALDLIEKVWKESVGR